MSKITGYLKENNRYELLIKGIIALVFPLFLCVLFCALQGKSIGNAYLPNSEWNDELFYYKQVEGIVNNGFPKGYFGFNESHAEVMSFAAWSPILVFPWVIWGLIFGWNLLSPIICNIVLLCVASCAFVLLTKPSIKQMTSLGIGMVFFIPFERYMLSGMPEIICFSMVIIFVGLSYNCLKKEKIWKIAILFALSLIMTLMRPYLILFMFLPIFLLVRKKKVLGAIISAVVLIVTLGLYAVIKKFLGADYFTPLFSMNWLTDFMHFGIVTGFKNLLSRLYEMGSGFYYHSIEAFRSGLASGAFFVTFMLTMVLLAVQFVIDLISFVKEKKETKDNEDTKDIKDTKDVSLQSKLILEGHYVFTMFGMFVALLLMYKLTEGSKHLLTFIAAGVFVNALLTNKTWVKNIIIAIAFFFFFVIKANSAYDYAVPYSDAYALTKTDEWKSAFEESIVLTDDAPSFDNVVIWNLYDYKDSNVVFMKWQRLYALPEGCGISCCNPDYVMENIDSLKSKYITTLTGGQVDEALKEKGYEVAYKDAEVTLYILR